MKQSHLSKVKVLNLDQKNGSASLRVVALLTHLAIVNQFLSGLPKGISGILRTSLWRGAPAETRVELIISRIENEITVANKNKKDGLAQLLREIERQFDSI